MNEQIIEQMLSKVVFSSLSGIYVFDAMNDLVISYTYSDSKFVVNSKTSLTSYLEDIKTKVKTPYLPGYMNSISSNKLEEVKNSGGKIEFEYQTLDNRNFSNTSLLLENGNQKLVLVLSKEEKGNTSGSIVTDDAKYSSLLESVSDSILKIHNIFSLDSKMLTNIKGVEEYINSVFSGLTATYPELKKALNKNAANITGMADETILIVDDDTLTVNMLKRIFQNDFKIATAGNGQEAIDYLEANSNKGLTEKSDNILGIFLDLTMPVMDGFGVLEYLQKQSLLSEIPVIVISGEAGKETKTRAYNYNIADMLEKPFDFQVVKHRISNFINLYKSSNSLNMIINSRSEILKNIVDTFIFAYKADYDVNIKRIREYVKILGKQIMTDYPEYALTDTSVLAISNAVEFYDIGLYSIPKTILNKKGYTEQDIKAIKNYPNFGLKMLDYILDGINDDLYKQYSRDIVQYYHENYDGTGYPTSLKEDNIPLAAQIASICIMYNNLIKNSPEPSNVIIGKSGIMFNPKFVGSFMKVLEQFNGVK